ncbi:MAG: hypothetical protein MAG451_02291 [Anaerolineales bacterium]|nr:hypothetical protein [Anaerolineales bacterium]
MRIPATRKLTLVMVVVVAFMALLGSVWFVNQVSAGSAATPAFSSPQTIAPLDDDPEPEIDKIVPDEGEPGQTLDVVITGENTHFSSDSDVTFLPPAGPVGGITVLSTTVSSDAEMTVTIEIAPDARPGKRAVVVATPLAIGRERVVERDGFEVEGGDDDPPHGAHREGTIIEINVVNTDTATIVVEDEDGDHNEDGDHDGESLAPSDSVTWTVHITAATRIRFKHDGPATIADLEVGQEVKVVGQLQADGSVLAHKIRIEQDDEDEEREVGFRGAIEEIITGTNTLTLTVQVGAGPLTLTVIVDDETEIEGPDDTPLTPADLEVGQEVKGKGTVLGSRTVLYATEIEVLEEDDDHRQAVRFEGTIKSLPQDPPIGEWVVELEGHSEMTATLIVTERTQIVPPHIEPAVGDEVEVVALRQADGTLLALVIHVEKEGDRPPRPVEFRGTVVTGTVSVTSTLPLTIWVKVGMHDGVARVVEVRIDERTRIEDEGLPIEEGDRVKVRGFLKGDIVVALRIEAEDDEDDREVEFKGRIQRMTDSLWVVGGFTVQITDTTVITGATPAVGLIAEVEGTRRGPRTMLAKRIEVEDHGAGHRRVVIRGTIITGTLTDPYSGTWEIDVMGGDTISVEVTADTVVNRHHSGGTVEAGMLVEAIAVLQPDGALVAKRVRVFLDD